MRTISLTQRRMAHYRRLDEAFQPLPACRCETTPNLERLAEAAYPVPRAWLSDIENIRHHHRDLPYMQPAELGREHYRCTFALAFERDPHPWRVARLEAITAELRQRGQERR